MLASSRRFFLTLLFFSQTTFADEANVAIPTSAIKPVDGELIVTDRGTVS